MLFTDNIILEIAAYPIANDITAIQININGNDTFGKGQFIYKSQMMEVNHKLIRDELLTKGVELLDTREGTKFQIVK